MSFLNSFRRTDWRFVTSGGTELTVGVSLLFAVGGGAGSFYVRKNKGPIYPLPYTGLVAAGGRGIFAAADIVNVAVSLPWAPGGGFSIYENPLRSDEFGLEDFEGSFLSYSVGAGGLSTSRSCTAMFFGAPHWVALTGALQFPAIFASCAGFGVLWGSAISTGIAGGVGVMRGQIFATQRGQGETSYPLPDGVERIL